MSTVYTSGTKTDPGAVVLTNMAALQTTLRDFIVAQTGYTLVEEFDLSSNHWTIFKCAASRSGLPKDFHFAIVRGGSGAFTFLLFEDYTVSGRVIAKYAPAATASSVALDTDG